MMLLVALKRFSEDADTLADLAHLQEQSSKIGPNTALEYARRPIRGMMYADDAFIVPRPPRGLDRTVTVFDQVFRAFGLTISESKTDTMCITTSRASATQIDFNATG